MWFFSGADTLVRVTYKVYFNRRIALEDGEDEYDTVAKDALAPF